MPQLQVQKGVVVSFLEAAKLTLEHLGAWRLDLAARSAEIVSADLTRLYADVRRVRDYLQRSTAGYGDLVDLEFDRGDAAVLVACCRRALDDLDRQAERAGRPEEREAIEQKHRLYSDWILQLADRPLIDLPLRRDQVPSEATRTLTSKLVSQVFGKPEHRAVFKGMNGNSVSSMMLGVKTFGDEVHDMRAPGVDRHGQPPRATGDPDSAHGEPGDPPAPPLLPAWNQPGFAADEDDDVPLIAEASLAHVRATAAPLRAADVPAQHEPAEPAGTPQLFDPRMLRDPRLRALVVYDLGSYQRAVAASDYRIAAVVLASLLEAAVLDHVLPRRAEFALQGGPDAWDPHALLLRALGEQALPEDAALGRQLYASRALLCPGVQLVTPIVVTVASFVVLRDFVQRALHALGYGAPVAGLPPVVARTPGG